MAFISCRCRLTKVLAGTARGGGKETKVGGGRVRISLNINSIANSYSIFYIVSS